MDTPKQSILDHLEELRFRIIYSLIGIAVCALPGYLLAQPAIELLKRHACPPDVRFYYMEPMALFFVRLKLGFLLALLLALPWVVAQIWKFIAPALYSNERYYITRLSAVSCLLFIFGVAVATLGVFPALMRFSYGMSTEDIQPMLQVDKTVGLAIMLMLAFGVMFQLPIVVYFCVICGFISLDTMRKARPYIVVVIFALSAFLTPPDAVSQLCLGVPSWLLFELTLLLIRHTMKQRSSTPPQADDNSYHIDNQQLIESPSVETPVWSSSSTSSAETEVTAPVYGVYPQGVQPMVGSDVNFSPAPYKSQEPAIPLSTYSDVRSSGIHSLTPGRRRTGGRPRR
jgi:sec-independent protein translocase protein TatC